MRDAPLRGGAYHRIRAWIVGTGDYRSWGDSHLVPHRSQSPHPCAKPYTDRSVICGYGACAGGGTDAWLTNGIRDGSEEPTECYKRAKSKSHACTRTRQDGAWRAVSRS